MTVEQQTHHSGRSVSTSIQDDNISDEIDLSQLVRTLWRGKFLILFCAVIALIVGIWYAYVQAVPVYTSSTALALESRQEQVVDIESVMTGLGGDQQTINTEIEVIRSRGIAEKMVDQLSLMEDPEFNARLRPKPNFSIGMAVSFIREKLGFANNVQVTPDPRQAVDATIDNVLSVFSVSNVSNSFVFRITATTTAPAKSALMANILAELYIANQLDAKFAATEKATDWLTSRVAQLKIELETAEKEVKMFNANADLVSEEALIALNRQIKELRNRLTDAQTLRDDADLRFTQMRVAADTKDIILMQQAANDPALDRLAANLQENATAALQTTFDTRFDQVINRAILERDRAINQIDALDETIALQENKIARQSEDLVALQQLQREAEASRLIYEFFLGRLKETSVQQGIQQADSRVISLAVVPTAASAPRKSMILALSMMLGLMLGAALVLAREFSQNTFRESTELEKRTGYTVIGQIPSIPARRRKRVLKYLQDKPTSVAAEAIRNLRTSVLLSDIDNPPQIIMSTSSIPGEGKTTQSLAIAQNLTGLGKTVLLIEGDLRKRIFAEYFDIKDKKGLLSVLSADTKLEDAVVHEPSLNADVLIGEKSTTNPADIFSSKRFGEFLAGLRKQYDYIIIDTAPVNLVPDARVIGQSVDAVMYTVKWDSTTHRQVQDGLRALENVNVRVAGLVLGQIDARQMKRYGYGDSYGSYGGYYNN